ncbi:sugar kinase [Streptococcus halichoeri]|uniref:sugar kinase n=1 Tax=Streptococcus halichoeri TaxID=254785 RepID=UPI00135A70F4|nr:sugar kinase [Streptococcus halichoeri]
MTKILFFGEPLIRISPQTLNHFENAIPTQLFYGGSEVNIARALEGFGQRTKMLCALPANQLGDSFLQFLQANQIDTQHIQRTGQRIGLYFLENSFGCRQAQVIYDRHCSSLHNFQISAVSYDELFEGVTHVHFSGITLSLGQDIRDISRSLLEEAQKRGLTISLDLNFRSLLLAPEKAKRVFSDFASYADICFGIEPLMLNQQDTFFFNRQAATRQDIEKRMSALMDTFNFQAIFHTQRITDSYDRNVYQAFLLRRDEQLTLSPELKTKVLQRVGSGDAFVAGALYQLLHQANAQEIVNFAVASGTLKCTIEGDNMFESVENVHKVLHHVSDICR